MEGAIELLNRNAGAISLLLALVVAAATVFYALLTHRLVEETRRMREVQTEPALALRLEPSEHGVNFVNLVVENVGQGPARNIRFKAAPDFRRFRNQHVSDWGIFRHGLNYMAPGQKITLFLTSVLDDVHKGREMRELNFDVEVSFETPAGRVSREVFPLHFDSLEGYGTIGTPPLIEIAQSIKKMETQIGHLASGSSRLNVLVQSQEELARETEALLQHASERRAAAEVGPQVEGKD